MASPTARRHRELLVRCALLVGSTAFAILAVELGLRWFLPAPSSIRFEQNEAHSRRLERLDMASVIENDPELFWRLAPDQTMPEDGRWARGIVSNGQSFREDHEIPLRKRPGEIRLLFLGDSCTFGSGLLLEEGFVERVERMLHERYPEVPIECINAGVPGYSLFQGWRLLASKGFAFDPDLVVLTFGWNDRVEWDGNGDFAQYRSLKASLPPPSLRWSRTCGLLWSAFRERPQAGERSATRPRLLPAEFWRLLETVRAESERRNADLLLLVWPGRFNVDGSVPEQARTANQRLLYRFGEMERFGPEKGPGHLDLVALAQELRSRHSPDELFLDSVHGTSFFNRAIAEAIVNKITPWLEAKRSGSAPSVRGHPRREVDTLGLIRRRMPRSRRSWRIDERSGASEVR